MNHAYDLGHSAVIYATQQKYDLLASKAELLQQLQNLAQDKADAESQLAEMMKEGTGTPTQKAALVLQCEDIEKQEAKANEELMSVIDRCIALGIGASTELAEEAESDPTEAELEKSLKTYQAHRDAGNLTEEQSEEMKGILQQLARIAKNCDPKEAKASRPLATGETVTLKHGTSPAVNKTWY
jgi:hypothetical protein